MRKIAINRQKLGLEDLTFGVGTETQVRAGKQVVVTRINASNLPFDETMSLLEWVKSIKLKNLTDIIDELIAIYNNLTTLGNVENNLTMLNNIETSLTALNLIYTNISKLQNIDTHMPELQNIDTNLAILQAVYNNLTMLNNVEDTLTTINSVNGNLTQLLAIYNKVIPNLTELLQVNDNAAQVAADKLTVHADKLIVAQDKADVTAIKLAVESIYDSFDDRFLGAKITDPLVDNDGNPLVDGALYFNSSTHALEVYSLTDTTWYTIPQIYLSGLLDVQLTSITTGDILNWNGSKWINTRTPKFSTMQLTGGTGTAGTTSWNNAELTLDVILNNNVTLQVGQESLVSCKNTTGSTIVNGKVVMAIGTTGNSGQIIVGLHDGTKANARRVIGIATEDIVNNGLGFVTIQGKVRGLNTTGSTYGETWVDGDILYAKANGALTKVEPLDTELKMPIAFVLHSHTNGTLVVRTTGIDENHDRDFVNSLVDIHSKTAKTTLANTDEFMTADSTSTWSLKKITWANIKASLASLFIPKVTTPITNALAKITSNGTLENSAITIDDLGNIGSGTQSFNGFGGSGFKNYIINGNFNVNQRANTLSSSSVSNALGTFMDMWRYSNTSSTSSIELSKDAITYAGTTYNALKAIAPIAFNNTSGDVYSVYTSIEDKIAYTLQNKVFTVSFLAEVNNAGNYSFNIRKINDNGSVTTSYVKLIPLVVGVNKVTITVPADSSYISSSSSSGRGLNICFGVGVTGIPNTTEGWVSGNFVSHSNTFKWWNINGGYLKVAQFQLEEGSVATPFENRPYGLELSLCQRYYEVGFVKHWSMASGAAQTLGSTSPYRQVKRVTPFVTFSGTTLSNCVGLNTELDPYSLTWYANSSSSGMVSYQSNWSASAEL